MTTEELRELMVNADSPRAIDLAKRAHDKWVKQHSKDIVLALSLHDALESLQQNEQQFRKWQDKGVDVAARRDIVEQLFKQYCFSKSPPEEAERLWQMHQEGQAEREENMETLLAKAQMFLQS